MASESYLEPFVQKIKYYCSYQERCHREVRDKLYSFGLRTNEVELLIAKMIEADYLNEERFALSMARGKLRMNNWGKVKIIQALKAKQISAYNIKIALRSIDEDEYRMVLKKLADKYKTQLKGGTAALRRQKLIRYLLSKGFEIKDILETVDGSNE